MQSVVYSEQQAKLANLTLEQLGITSFDPSQVGSLQRKVGVEADGWLGPITIRAWKAWSQTVNPPAKPAPTGEGLLLGGKIVTPPMGVRIVPPGAPNGVPAKLEDISPRKIPVTQFVLHLGAETKMKAENYAQATERVLDARGLSTTFTMDADGTIYQHFDPVPYRGRHATWHNVQSDSIDIGGPYSLKLKPLPGQVLMTYMMAIGYEGDNKPPLTRKYAPVKCWSLTPEQSKALALFLPWYLDLRGIPKTACSDWRCFRLGGVGEKDPVTNVKGVLAHTQCAGPGSRTDGIRELAALKDAGVDLEWRPGDKFFN